jgi:hypothetical protein
LRIDSEIIRFGRAAHQLDSADGGQLHEPVCQRETVAPTVHLFFADRPPKAIDDNGRIVADPLDRAVEVFCPERDSGVAGQHRIAGRDVDLCETRSIPSNSPKNCTRRRNSASMSGARNSSMAFRLNLAICDL